MEEEREGGREGDPGGGGCAGRDGPVSLAPTPGPALPRFGGAAGRRGSVPSRCSLCYNWVGRPIQRDSLLTD